MNKIAVIYKSKYGSTKRYAGEIATNLQGDLFEASEVKRERLSTYDTIIFGGGLYASGINGIYVIKENFHNIKNKDLIVFTVGLASTDDKEIFKPIIEKSFTKEMIDQVQFFHMRGGIDYKKLSLIHKLMMFMLKTITAKKKSEELTEDDKMMLATYGDKVDFINMETIEPLILYVRDLHKTK